MLKSDQHEGECVEIIPPPQEQKRSGLARELQFGVVLVLSFPPVSYTDQKPRVKKTIAVGLI